MKPEDKPAYILCAAIHFDADIFPEHQPVNFFEHQPVNIPTGFVLTGRRHHNILALFGLLGHNHLDYNKIQGFITSKNQFVDRTEAAKIAYEAGQIDGPSDYLISEDLY